MTRNYTIDCIKLLLSAMIACHHFKGIFISSTTVVHIFFILSGFFLAQSFYRGKYGNDTFRYTCARLKRIYPYYLFAFFAYFLFTEKRILITEPITFCKDFCNSFSEIFLLQNVGIFGGGANYPLWQLCTLLVVSHVLFSLMVHDEQLTANVFCPLLFIGIYILIWPMFTVRKKSIYGVLNSNFSMCPFWWLSAPFLLASLFIDQSLKPFNGSRSTFRNCKFLQFQLYHL